MLKIMLLVKAKICNENKMDNYVEQNISKTMTTNGHEKYSYLFIFSLSDCTQVNYCFSFVLFKYLSLAYINIFSPLV